MGASIAQSVYRLATGWMVRASNLGEERDFPHQYRQATGPTQGSGVDQSPHLALRFKEE